MPHPINTPDLWRAQFTHPSPAGNKYDRGHAIVVGGGWQSTGASKLAAHAALRIGAGLVSVACDTQSLPIYATSFQAVMTKLIDAPGDLAKLLDDNRINAVLIGPGAGITPQTTNYVHDILRAKKSTVLDADALSCFAKEPQNLFDAIHSDCILTPHEGEFARLFGQHLDMQSDRITRAQQAAKLSKAIVILKGAETIIAAPDERYAINQNATPYLATAGSGDVLAGICLGLLSQKMPAFEAACAAVWLHGAAGSVIGPGLIAEDIADQLPKIMAQL